MGKWLLTFTVWYVSRLGGLDHSETKEKSICVFKVIESWLQTETRTQELLSVLSTVKHSLEGSGIIGNRIH